MSSGPHQCLRSVAAVRVLHAACSERGVGRLPRVESMALKPAKMASHFLPRLASRSISSAAFIVTALTCLEPHTSEFKSSQ